MKRILALLICLLATAPAHAAIQWDKNNPAGSTNVADLDSYITTINNEATDRLLVRYRRGMAVNYTSASTLSVLAGEIAIPDASDAVVKWRRTTAATSVGWSDIDTGVEAVSTQYYVYATADTDITGVVFKISANATSPSGATYYRKIAEFYNDSSGNITNVLSYREDYGADYADVAKAWINFTGTGTITINDSYNVASITDNGTGNYTITWSTAFANGSYAVVVSPKQSAANVGTTCAVEYETAIASGSVKIECNDSGSLTDPPIISVIAFGDRT